jgi:hypothetical protein
MPIVTLETGQKLTFPEGTTSDQINFAVDEFVTKNGISPQEAPQAPETTQPAQEQPQSFQEQIKPYRRSASEDAKTMISALYSGAEDLGTGIYQAAADLGFDFSGAKKVLSMVRPDLREQIQSLTPEDISQVLADKQKAKNAAEADKPLGFKVIKEATKIAPFLAAGSTTGKLVSEGVASLGTAAKAVAPILGLGASGAVGGAEISALSPQEEAGLGNRAVETAKGAATGAAFGTALGVGGKVVGAIGNAGKSLFTAKSAEDILAARLPKEQTTALLEQLKTATPDNPVLLPDIAGDSIKGLTRSVAKISTARDIVTDALEKRSQGAVSRVANQLSRDISPVDAYFGNLDDLSKARSEVSKPLYEQAYAEGNKNIQKLLKPKVTKEARFVSDGSGGVKKEITRTEIPAPPLFSNPNIQKYIAKAKNDPLFVDPRISNNDFAVLDGAKKIIDDDISLAMRAGEKEKARALIGIKKQIIDKLDEVSPTYKQARQVFGGFSQLKSAQEAGLDFSKLRPEEVRREIKGLSAAERDAYRIGVRENLQKTVSSTADGADPAKRIFGNEFKREQLKAVFGNEKKFAEFEQKMANEIRAADTKAKVLGGSRTDYNMAGDEEFLNKIINGGIKVAKSKVNPLYLVEATYNALTNKFAGINEKNAADLAKILVNRPDTVKALESIIEKQQNPLQKRALNEAKQYILTNILTKSVNQ